MPKTKGAVTLSSEILQELDALITDRRVSSSHATLDEDYLRERTGRVPPKVMAHVDAGLKLVLDL